MDSDVMAPGSIQRLRLGVIEPKLRALADFTRGHMRADLGEVAVLVQYAYELAAPHCQRVWRGATARTKAGQQQAYFRFVAMTAAALEIQRYVRAASARAVVAQLKAGLLAGKTVGIQALWRGALARMRVAKLKADKLGQLLVMSSFTIQRVWRRVAALKRVRLRAAALEAEEYAVVFSWAVATVQRYVRGHQAKAVTVQKKVELGLSERLTRVAHKYLQSGDLWGFLQAVNDDYVRC